MSISQPSNLLQYFAVTREVGGNFHISERLPPAVLGPGVCDAWIASPLGLVATCESE